MMTESTITDYLLTTYPKLTTTESAGNIFFFVDPAKMFPFATIMTNSQYDKVSNLENPGRYRFNLGITKTDFQKLFGDSQPTWDYTITDTLMPHPDYASQYFICVVNPSSQTFEKLKPMIKDAYSAAEKRYQEKM